MEVSDELTLELTVLVIDDVAVVVPMVSGVVDSVVL